MIHLSAIQNKLLIQLYKDTINQISKELEETRRMLEDTQESLDKSQKENTELRKTVNTLRNSLVEICKVEGSIKISKVDDTTLKIQKASYPLLNNKKTLILENNYAPEIIYKNIVSYIHDYPQEFIQYIGNNKFNITDEDKSLELIKNIMTNNIDYTVNIDYALNKEQMNSKINEYQTQLEQNPNISLISKNRIHGKMYECHCSKITGAQLWNNAPKYYLNQFRLTNNDIGCDLIDIGNKILYQCKYYASSLTKLDLITFIRTIDIFRSLDSEYESILLVPDMSVVPQDLCNLNFVINEMKFTVNSTNKCIDNNNTNNNNCNTNNSTSIDINNDST